MKKKIYSLFIALLYALTLFAEQREPIFRVTLQVRKGEDNYRNEINEAVIILYELVDESSENRTIRLPETVKLPKSVVDGQIITMNVYDNESELSEPYGYGESYGGPYFTELQCEEEYDYEIKGSVLLYYKTTDSDSRYPTFCYDKKENERKIKNCTFLPFLHCEDLKEEYGTYYYPDALSLLGGKNRCNYSVDRYWTSSEPHYEIKPLDPEAYYDYSEEKTEIMGGDTIWNSTMTIYEKYGRAVVSPEISDVTYSVVFDVDYINDNDFNYYDSRNCFCLIPTEKMDLIIPDNYNKYNRYGDSNPRFNSALITNNEISFRTITFFENGTSHNWSDVDELLMRMSCDVAYVPEEMYDEVIENSHYNVGDFNYFGTGVKSIQKIGKSGVDPMLS